MRLAILTAALALVPQVAEAATVTREGSEIVFRSAPGESDRFSVDMSVRDGKVRFENSSEDGATISPGAGCGREGSRPSPSPGIFLPPTDATCDTAGVTVIRILTGDGDDHVNFGGPGPVAIEFGPGDDSVFTVQPNDAIVPADSRDPGDIVEQIEATVAGGDGDDRIELTASRAVVTGDAGDDMIAGSRSGTSGPGGPWRIDGGAGDDRLTAVEGLGAATLAGGPGDDRLVSLEGGGITADCGAGADTTTLASDDRAGEGCAPHLSGFRPDARFGTYSRARNRVLSDLGRISRAGSIRVTVFRRIGFGRREALATARVDVEAGRVRLSLRPTRRAARRLRRDPRQSVFVSAKVSGSGRDVETGYWAAVLR